MDHLLQFDFTVFQFIHQNLSNSFFDILMPFLKNRYTWVPLYVFILLFSFFNMNWKKAISFIVLLLLTVILSDTLSSQFIKKSVKRTRPCHEVVLKNQVTPLVHCGSGYSFPSSHATNHFAIAFYIILMGWGIQDWLKWSLLLWASLISFAQVYTGVHYPLDILAGAILGYLIARFISIIIPAHKLYHPTSHP